MSWRGIDRARIAVAFVLMMRSKVTACALAVLTAASAAVALGGCGSTPARSTQGTSTEGSEAHIETANSGRSSCKRAKEPAPHEEAVPPPSLGLYEKGTYLVTLWTNCGTIKIALDVTQAPLTTASFAYLVNAGFYNGLTFHNITAHLAIEGGDPDEDGLGGPGYEVIEPPSPGTRYPRGTVAMAKTVNGPSGASGSQFFIVTAKHADLPPQFALIGRVVGSFTAVNAIASLPTDPTGDGHPDHPVVIREATITVG